MQTPWRIPGIQTNRVLSKLRAWITGSSHFLKNLMCVDDKVDLGLTVQCIYSHIAERIEIGDLYFASQLVC